MDVALGINYAQDFDLNVNLNSIDVDDVAPPTVKLIDPKRHASLLPSFLLGGIHGWGTTFGCLTVKGLNWITLHSWCA